eukprot:GILK01004820.1.p1 GENE.GILK01004820.1~~GILK01004820.1.p1  ORF type:complete len:308 (+),score=33.06 GILK01004820.1:48-971(+)
MSYLKLFVSVCLVLVLFQTFPTLVVVSSWHKDDDFGLSKDPLPNPVPQSQEFANGVVAEVECGAYEPFFEGCHPTVCKRLVVDKLVSDEEVARLLELTERGMQGRSKLGGPTILDIGTGFVRDGDGMVKLYESTAGKQLFSDDDFKFYASVLERIRQRLISEYNLSHLYFTAPTFIARLVGNETWSPKTAHDEYFHPHVDKQNTPHYDYSGLLYLADYQTDFTGGDFVFIDGDSITTVEPRKGRLIMFNSGAENPHQVRKVKTGTRYALSLWFTCNPERLFEPRLSPNTPARFSHANSEAYKRKQEL